MTTFELVSGKLQEGDIVSAFLTFRTVFVCTGAYYDTYERMKVDGSPSHLLLIVERCIHAAVIMLTASSARSCSLA